MGAPRARLRPRVADRGGRRPPQPRHLPRLVPHPLARRRPERDPRHPGREDLLPPARRRARAGDGRAPVEPPLPLLPGPGRLRPRGLPRPRAGGRLRRAALARSLQRRLPPGRPGADGGRRDALAAAARGRAPARRRAARLRVRRAGGRAGAGGGARAAADRDGLPPRRAAPLEAGAAVAPRRDARPRQPRAAVRGAADRRDRGRERRPDPLRRARRGAARAEPAARPRAGRGRPHLGRRARRHRAVLLRHRRLGARLHDCGRAGPGGRADPDRPRRPLAAVRLLRRGGAVLPLRARARARGGRGARGAGRARPQPRRAQRRRERALRAQRAGGRRRQRRAPARGVRDARRVRRRRGDARARRASC